MSEIASVAINRLEIPLSDPYRLSNTTVESFDTVLVSVTLSDGNRGIGEATPLEGYSTESVEDVWSVLTTIGSQLPDRGVDTARKMVDECRSESGLAAAAVNSALTTAVRGSLPTVEAPIVGILSTAVETDAVLPSLETQLEAGFETMKIKVGFDPDQDAERVTAIVEAAPDDVPFRVDANQGYTLAEARRFLERVPRERLQLIEQPLPVGHLDDHAVLKREYDVPVMLDEEIREVNDLEMVNDVAAADAVKFKLMKMGGWEQTRRAIQHARESGFDIVLGNGVQSDVGCIHEAILWSETQLELAGEFNGWLKQAHPVQPDALRFINGNLRWRGKSISIAGIQSYVSEQDQYR